MSDKPNLLQGPEPVETADLHFKQYCKLKLFETQAKYEDGHCNLVAVSQHYGLIFARSSTGFSVIKSKSLSPSTDAESFPRKDVTLNHRATHLCIDFSQKILAVVCTLKPGSMVLFYNIASFSSKDVMPMKIPNVSNVIENLPSDVCDIQWQPNTDSGLTLSMLDGSVITISKVNAERALFTLPNTTQATCFCWSPKGKQIVIGGANGTLSQYKPNLKIVKTIPPPPLFNGAVMVVNVLWVSSFQFAVAYNDRNSPESFPVITIVNANKNETVNVINYDDITYSSTLFRNHQIYMTHQSAWNLIFVSSANGIEVAVLHSKDGTAWEQWLLGDASRAELPLNPDRQETFPLGWGFDYTSEETIPWGEGTLPPMPRLLLLSDEGWLCIYNIVNVAENAPRLCEPPKEILDDSLFASPSAHAPVASQPPVVAQPSLSFTGDSSAFGSLKGSYTFGSASTFGGLSLQPQSTTPQVTISLQGGPVLGSVKDAQTILQQQQQQQQNQPPVQQVQIFQQPQQPVVASTQSLPAATPLFKFSTTTQSAAPAAPTFSFQPSTTTSLFAAKAAAAGGSSESTPVIKFGAPQGSLFTGKPAAPPGDIFAGKNLFQSTPIKQSEPVQEKLTPEQAPPSTAPEIVVPAKREKPSVKRKSPGESPEPGTPELAAVDDSVYWNALQEEIDHFNSEVQQLSARVGTLDIQVGTEEDKRRMREKIEALNDFSKELKETTESQKSEIHTVVMDLMESFAWLEDAKSRNLQRKNPSYIELKRTEELDPLSARHVSDIAHYKYYIENQVKQLTSYLDKEWMDHQESYRRDVKSRMGIPPLEEVYKTMHLQLKILNKQRAIVEELKESIALKKRKNKSQTALITASAPTVASANAPRVSELSKLAENLLQLRINREESSPKSENWDVVRSQLKAISERTKKLTGEKQMALRDALIERNMVKIRPVKTTFETSSFLRPMLSEKTLSKSKQERKLEKEKQNVAKKSEVAVVPPKVSPRLTQVEPKPLVEAMAEPSKKEPTKTLFVFGVPPGQEKPPTVPSLPPKQEDKSPLVSLSGIVSSIGKEPEVKPSPPSTFIFGFSKPEPPKDAVVFGGTTKPEQKPDEGKTDPTFTFGVSKPSENVFGKSEPPKFGTKLTFEMPTSTPAVPAMTKSEAVKSTPAPNVSITPVTTTAVAMATTAAAPTTSTFTFSLTPSTTSSSTPLPKMNLLFTGKEQTTGFGSTVTTGSLFGASSTPAQSSTASIFGSSTPIFGTAGGKSGLEMSTPLFGTPKTSADSPAQSVFSFSLAAESKPKTTEPVVVISSKPALETEEVDVVTVEEPLKKPEASAETKAKDSPKATVAPSIFGVPAEPPKATVTTSSSAAPPNVQVVSTPQSTVATTTSVASKPATVTSADTSTAATSVAATKPTVTSTTAAPVFSFSTTTPLAVGQTATTTAVTTTTSIFGQGSTTTSSIFAQVSSTTPTANIFGGATPTTPTTNIFGGSTPTSTPVFAQALAPSTTTGSIFGGTTSTTNTFGQPASPSSPSSFGQNPDSVSQTANIFGQLLSGSGFGSTPSTPTTAGNIFTTPTKNLFGGGSSTTTPPANLFGGGTTSPSAFPQTSVFGQSTTSSSLFGQSQTSTSNSFFGQNICSPFGGSTSVTSNQSSFESGGFNSKPVFGQSLFGQTTNNTSIFGGSPSSSIFGGSPTSGTNVFQTPTTSQGPFSGGQGSVAKSGFGATGSTFQKPLGGFGSPPVFGSTPAAPSFGGSPTFGGSASFGSLPTFGSRPFDSSSGGVQGTFGQSTAFENFANQNTVGFGNLAQQSQSQGFGGGFGSSTNKPNFGGNSFSGWRS